MSWRTNDIQVIERCAGVAGEIQLQKRGTEYEIIYNGVFLMATYNGASEKEAVAKALDTVLHKGNSLVRVLMGGLGVGYSLRKALECRSVSEVVVAELEPAVVRWNRTVLQEVNNNALEDPRVKVINNDFREILEEAAKKIANDQKQSFQVIMVDTDNGSSWLSLPSNSFFYEPEGLQLIKRCLSVGGIVCFWCASRENAFEFRLKHQFCQVHFHWVEEKTGQEGCYYLAVKR